MPNKSNGAMFGDLDWPLNASRRFVSISWASFYELLSANAASRVECFRIQHMYQRPKSNSFVSLLSVAYFQFHFSLFAFIALLLLLL